MTGIKPICPTCRKKSISLFRKTQNIREFVAYYCENCNKIIDPIERLDTIIHRQDIRDFLTSHKKTYNLILADPPWHYTINSLPQNRQVENHYDTMSTDELCNLPVQNIAKVPSILFMWCPNAKKDDALKVLQSWGFRYVTKLTWIKTARNGQPRIGLGNNVRNTSEDIVS